MFWIANAPCVHIFTATGIFGPPITGSVMSRGWGTLVASLPFALFLAPKAVTGKENRVI